AGAAFTINTRPATWTTSANSKTYGDSDPNPLTTGSGTFLAADGVTATYTRAAGETVLGGPYHITATLAPAAVLSNYAVTNAGAAFTINKATPLVCVLPSSTQYSDPATLKAYVGLGSCSNITNGATGTVTFTVTGAAGTVSIGPATGTFS